MGPENLFDMPVDLAGLGLGEIIDAEMLQSLMDDFYKLSGIPVGIIDLKGNILVAEGWQDICVKFHRVHPDACRNCLESDLELTEGIRTGEFRQYKCKNQMWDLAAPIWVGDHRLGHIFLGQFFFEDETVDIDLFRQQARKYGFDEEAYLQALQAVPRFSRETVNTAMAYYAKLAGYLSRLSFSNLLLNRSVRELENTAVFQEALMDAVPSPIYYKDSNCVYISCNKAFEQYMGLPREAMIGKTVYGIAPPELAKIYDRADRELLASRGIQIYEAAVETSDSIRRDVVFHKAVFFNAEGDIAGIIGVILDISDQKKAEAALRETNDQLELKVEARTSELMALNEELIAINEELVATLDRLKSTQQQLLQSEKMAALGGLVAGISHEISTPLGISVTSVSYVQQELSRLARAYAEGALGKKTFEEFLSEGQALINTTAKNLQRAELLLHSFKQISVDQTRNEWRRFGVKSYLDELLISLNPLFKNKPCEITVLCDETLEIMGYPGLLAQIVTNLVTNSVRHAFEPQATGIIQISFRKEGSTNTLEYQDSGRGMSPEVLKHIFEPFFTTKRGAEGGTGLGLHLVYNLVTQRMGGEIQCRSTEHQGTQFTIVFPDVLADPERDS